jgi:hypothetical protein
VFASELLTGPFSIAFGALGLALESSNSSMSICCSGLGISGSLSDQLTLCLRFSSSSAGKA